MLLAGCATGYRSDVIPPFGLIYADYKAPMDWNVNGTKMGSKTGIAESTSILGLIALGDCSINTAAKNGNIQTINHADYSYMNVLGVYQSFKTTVYGE
ncbi:MAG: TRL-like family protein [Candidatus Sumerlaeota bacterium]|nr:TRL-like family protein [Candidatus Sumerlaeota bacterium]